MNSHTTVDLLTIALELRLAAHDPKSVSQRLTVSRLLKMAAILETAADRDEPSNQKVQVRALRALSRATR